MLTAVLYVVGIGLLVTGLLLLLRHEFKRIERERRMREWLAANPRAAELRAQLERMQHQIAHKITPAMQQMAQEINRMAPSLAAIGKALRKDKP